jgi:hypothetical protein
VSRPLNCRVRTVGDSTSYWKEWSFAKVLNRIPYKYCSKRSFHPISLIAFLKILNFFEATSRDISASDECQVFLIDSEKGNAWKRFRNRAISLTHQSEPSRARYTARFFQSSSAHPRGGGTPSGGKGATLIPPFYKGSNQLTGSVLQPSAQTHVRPREILKIVYSPEYPFVAPSTPTRSAEFGGLNLTPHALFREFPASRR